MTFQELDRRIREALPDGIERRQILEGLHEIEEGVNLTANFYLAVTGHICDEHGRYYKPKTTKYQVNANLSGNA